MPIYRSLGWELAGGKYQATVPARSLWALAAPDKSVATSAPADSAVAAVRRAGPDDAAEITGIIGRAHQAARDAGPLTWDEGPFRPANSGTWQLEVADGKGALTPAASPGAQRAVPLALGARGLAALYAGTPVATLRLAGLATGGAPDTDAALDAVFAATSYMVDDF